MRRREFIAGAGALGAFAALGARAAAPGPTAEAAAPELASRAAWRELLELLRELDQRYLGAEWGVSSDQDVADGHRFLTSILSAAIDFYMEGDPERPRFTRIVSPTRRFGGDNPDASYFYAPVRGDRAYRIRGRIQREVYLSYTIHGGTPEGGWNAPVIGALNHRQLQLGPDGSYELILSPERREGNSIQLEPGLASVVTRHYFLEEQYAPCTDRAFDPVLSIEPLEPQPAPAPLDGAQTAERLRKLAFFLRELTLDRPPPPPEKQPAWVGREPNTLGVPGGWDASGGGGWGALDNVYASGRYQLGPDEALVMEGRFPECVFANVVLWNRFLATYDYTHRRISLNRRQCALRPDGSYRIAIAARDPGIPNWLDTEGRPSGQIFWRFQLPTAAPEQPRCRVVPVDQVASLT
jgi:hypothetical protein